MRLILSHPNTRCRKFGCLKVAKAPDSTPYWTLFFRAAPLIPCPETPLNSLLPLKNAYPCDELVAMGRRPLDSEVADAEFYRHGLEPLEPYKTSNTPRRCRCITCGRTIVAKHRHVRLAKRQGCRYCLRLRVDPSDAIQRMTDNGFTPHGPYPGSQTPWLSTCATTGETVSPTLARVTSNGHSCSACKSVLMRRPRLDRKPIR